MNATLLTKNRRGRRGSPRVSLFPFLAVLICTMGALVLILFAVMRQARIQAVRAAAAKTAQQQVDWKAEREIVRWRTGQIQESHKKTAAQLADLRLSLGHLEDHARRLRERTAQLESAAKSVDQTARQRLAGTQEELQKAQARIADAQRQLDDARKAAQQRPRSYAIIPYEGPNETHRRPIYLECRADAVLLQPEGIALGAADFDGPLGAGNPLAAALRTVREHLLSQGSFDPDRDGEPYPLLLVRPSGIAAYYAARAAVQSYASDFGYELIGEDWTVQFPPADPRLVPVVNQAVASARRRQQELIAAAPIGYRGRSRGTYRASPTGGLMREGGPAGDDDGDDYDMPRFQSVQPAGRYGSPYEPGGGVSSGPAGGAGLPYAGGATAGGGAPGGNAPPATSNLGGSAPQSAGGGGSRQAASSAPMGAVAAQGTGGGPAATGPAGTSAPRSDGGAGGQPQGRPPTRPEGYVPGRPFEVTESRQPSADAQPGTPLRPGEWYPSERPPPEPRKKPDPDDNRRGKEMSLAEKRGRDWGLRNAANGSVPLTRPIRVECFADRLVILPEPGSPAAAPIPLDARTGQSIDRFMAAVWEHIETWGIAGKGMYWRPVLKMRVAPGSEQRFLEVSSLLDGSGLTVQREP